VNRTAVRGLAREFDASEGPANLQALSALVKDNDADLVVGAAALLFDGGRKREGVSLLKWAAPLLPRSVDFECALGEALLAMGDKAGSRSAFEKALALLPEDVTLDAGQKAESRKAAEEGLKALRK
jgi:Flp pilus assembly protein TadD